jgi:hypothetical protein
MQVSTVMWRKLLSLLAIALNTKAWGSGNVPLGSAIGRITTTYAFTRSGRFIGMMHHGAGDPYYQWWGAPANRGSDGALPGKHVFHLCRCDLIDCKAKSGSNEVVHLSVWCKLGFDEAFAKLESWKEKDDAVALLENEAEVAEGDEDEKSLFQTSLM